MKNLKQCLPLIILIACTIFSCGEDDENAAPTYVDYEVAFFRGHPNAIITPTEFETVSRQRLSKEEHKQGATFETVTEQFLVVEESFRYIYSDDNIFNMTTNAETNTLKDITCRSFRDVSNIVTTPVPAQFATMTKQRVLVDGTGPIIPAQFSTYELQMVVNDAQLNVQSNTSRESEIIIFRLETDISVEEHIQNELNSQSISGCLNGDGYLVQ